MTRNLRSLVVLCLLALPASALDRSSFTITVWTLRATLDQSQQALEVQGHITLRNDTPLPQRAVSLQISSTLQWQSIRAAGKAVTYISQPYATDIDHTGAVQEALFNLPTEVSPGNSVELDVAYVGTIPRNATRLTRIGVPEQAALHTDWDGIGETFTAVRGVGYVCWYPVAMDSVSLSEGPVMFEVLGAWKARHADSAMHLTMVVASDQTMVTNGRLTGQKASTVEENTVHERNYEFSPLGLTPPIFAISVFTVLSRPAINVLYLADHQAAAEAYAAASEKISPLMNDWFGQPRQKLGVMELPAGYAPFDSGTLLFSPLNTDQNAVQVSIAHQLAHARIESSRLWIEEGLAHFAQALVRETQDGRKGALEYMQQFRPALAEAEKPAAAAVGAPSAEGQPLIRATDEIYYRAKAMFIWWMLRDMAGDAALQHVLTQYRAGDDKEPAYVQRLLETQSKRSFQWFFDDWVYRDRGLPDFRVTAAFPRTLLPDEVSVTVTVQNDGSAAAEVPVFIPVERGQALQRVLVPAHGQAVTRLTIPALPAEAVVNDGSVPEANATNNRFPIKKPE